MLPDHPITTYQRNPSWTKKLIVVFATLIVLTSAFYLFKRHQQQIYKPAVAAAETTIDNFPLPTYSWKPDYSTATPSAKLTADDLIAKSALVMNLDTGQVYFAKNPQMELPMASITKIMTIDLALEQKQTSDLFSVSPNAASVGENSMGVVAGEKYTLEELLYGILLQSGNDAAETIAENVDGSEQNFVTLMNKQAQAFGLTQTNYVEPTGLGANYTTAQDLAILTKYTLEKYPWLLDISKTITYTLPQNQYHHEVDLTSELDLVRTYPGTVGFKGGFTNEAGYCIVTVTQDGGQRVLAIVLGSTNRKQDAAKMLDYAFGLYGIKIEHPVY